MPLDSGTYKINSCSLSKTPQFSMNSPGLTLSLANYTSKDHQTWIVRRKEDGHYTIRNAGYADLDPAYAIVVKDASGSKVELGKEPYYWKIVKGESGFRILNHSGDLAWEPLKAEEIVYLTRLDPTEATGAQMWRFNPLLEDIPF